MYSLVLWLVLAWSRRLQVLECDEFYGLGPEQVAALIASDTITVPNEEKVEILLFLLQHLPSNFLGVWKRYCLDPALGGSSCSASTLPYGAHQTASAQPRLSHPQGFCLRMRLPTLAILWLLWTGWQWAFAEAEWQLQGLHNWGHEVPPSQGSHEKVQSCYSNTLNAISPSVFHIWCAFGFREIWSLQWPWHLPEQSQGNLLACQRWKKNTEECFESECLLITGDACYWWSGSKGYQVVVAEESYPILTWY